jgi:hypothetical protein
MHRRFRGALRRPAIRSITDPRFLWHSGQAPARRRIRLLPAAGFLSSIFPFDALAKPASGQAGLHVPSAIAGVAETFFFGHVAPACSRHFRLLQMITIANNILSPA